MRLDNKQVSANILNSGDNLIMCSCLQEAFFDIYNVEIQGESFIKKADRVIDGCPIIKLNVEHHGIEYKDVEFKLVAADADEVFINETLLQHGFEYAAPAQSLCIEQQLYEIVQEPQYIEPEPEPIEIVAAPNASMLKEQARNSQEKRIKKTLNSIYNKLNEQLQQQLHQAKTSMLQETLMSQMQMQHQSQQKLDESVNGLQQEFVDLSNQLQKVARNFTDAAVAKFKDTVVEQCNALLQETNATQLEHLQLQIKQNAIEAKDALQQNLKKSFKEKFQQLSAQHTEHHQQVQVFVEQQLQHIEQQIKLQQISTFEDSVAALMNDQSMFVDNVVNDKIAFIQESLNSLSQQLQQTLLQQMQSSQSDAQQHLQQMSEQVHGKLATVDNAVSSAVADASAQLTQHVDNLNASRLATVEQQVEQILREQFAQASQDTVVEEASQDKAISSAINKFKNQLNKDLQAQAATLQSELYRKFAVYVDSMGGGGGSVAVQYANGGTMKGSLNVTNGQILSGGVDLATIFSGGGGIASGAYLPLSGGTLTGAVSTTNVIYTTGGNSNQWNNAYSTVQTSSASWNPAGSYLPLAGGTLTGDLTVDYGFGAGAALLRPYDLTVSTSDRGATLSYSQLSFGRGGDDPASVSVVPFLGTAGTYLTITLPAVDGQLINDASTWPNANPIGWFDAMFYRDGAANTIAQRNSTNAQTFRVYNTYTNASNYERGFSRWSSSVFQIGTEKLGTGAARSLGFLTDNVTRMSISSAGFVNVPVTLSATSSYAGGLWAGATAPIQSGDYSGSFLNQNGLIMSGTTGSLAWSNQGLIFGGGVTRDLFLLRGAANTLYQRNGTNAQNLWLANTYTNDSNYERAVFGFTSNVLRIGTEKLGTGVARAIDFVVGGSTFLSLNTSGNLVYTGSLLSIMGTGVNPPTNTYALFPYTGVGLGIASQTGMVGFTTANGTEFCRITTTDIKIGGTTSAFPALKRSGATLQARLADDSAFAGFSCANLSATNVVYASGGNSDQWNNVYSTVQTSSASWGGGAAVEDANNIIGLSMFL